MRLKADFNGVQVQQTIHAFETADHYVSVTVSIQEPQDRAVLEAAVKTIAKTR